MKGDRIMAENTASRGIENGNMECSFQRNIVVIGGSAAGPKTAAKARRVDQNANITLIQKGPYLSMASCGYPYYVGGTFDNPDQLISSPTGKVRDPGFFQATKAIRALVNTEAISIDRDKKLVKIRNVADGSESEISYDRLILTTGAKPFIPPVPGIDLKGVMTLQSMEDAMVMKDVVKSSQRGETGNRAVVIGGGLIGMESCEALELGGFQVTVVEMLDGILGFLDTEMSLLVEEHARSKGSRIITSTAVKEILGNNGKVTGVLLSDGTTIDCDMVVVSVGVRPNADLAKDAGLKTGDFGGIRVNQFMQTSDPHIYAAGDCIEVTNLITGRPQHWPMGDAANLQGRVAGNNAASSNTARYQGTVLTGICKLFDFTAGSVGLSEKSAMREGFTDIVTSVSAGPDKPSFMGGAPIVIKLVCEGRTGRLLGMQAVGMGDVAKRVATAAVAIQAGMTIHDMVNLDLPYAPPFSPAIDNLITAVHVMENKLLGRMESISSVEVKKIVDEETCPACRPAIIDVRGPDEFEAMRLSIGEKLIPLGKLREAADKAETERNAASSIEGLASNGLPLDLNHTIIVYCKISLRGYEAASYLESRGYNDVLVMEGGILAWPFGKVTGPLI
jgi:NADPH-dependent 2,4-dienoyl-CoA reductase/sulfur reductase-like enzyme/rhodanese-related sulfurtransferase